MHIETCFFSVNAKTLVCRKLESMNLEVVISAIFVSPEILKIWTYYKQGYSLKSTETFKKAGSL